MLNIFILFTVGVTVVDPGEKPNKRQSNPESNSPGHDDKFLVAPSMLEIGSVDKEIDSFNNSTAHVERHNTFEGNESFRKCNTGFVRVLENLESHGNLKFQNPGLENMCWSLKVLEN